LEVSAWASVSHLPNTVQPHQGIRPRAFVDRREKFIRAAGDPHVVVVASDVFFRQVEVVPLSEEDLLIDAVPFLSLHHGLIDVAPHEGVRVSELLQLGNTFQGIVPVDAELVQRSEEDLRVVDIWEVVQRSDQRDALVVVRPSRTGPDLDKLGFFPEVPVAFTIFNTLPEPLVDVVHDGLWLEIYVQLSLPFVHKGRVHREGRSLEGAALHRRFGFYVHEVYHLYGFIEALIEFSRLGCLKLVSFLVLGVLQVRETNQLLTITTC